MSKFLAVLLGASLSISSYALTFENYSGIDLKYDILISSQVKSSLITQPKAGTYPFTCTDKEQSCTDNSFPQYVTQIKINAVDSIRDFDFFICHLLPWFDFLANIMTFYLT